MAADDTPSTPVERAGGVAADAAGPLRGFVVVRQFGTRIGSGVAGSAFGNTDNAYRPGALRRLAALLLLVVLIVPVLVLFVLFAVAALVIGIVVSLVAAILRPFRGRSPTGHGPGWHVRAAEMADDADGPDGPPEATGPIGRDREGRENVRVARPR